MNNQKIDSLINSLSEEVEGGQGQWQFSVGETLFICLTDETHNRMRVIAPIIEEKEMDVDDAKRCLVANFHTALDVKYALSEGIVWAVFIHPLKELSDDQFKDGVRQVYNAAVTYGDSFSSTELVFPSPKMEEEIEKQQEEESQDNVS